jgi:hypothetical protein
MYGEEHAAEAEKLGLSVPPPSLAVEIQVLEGFLQTPGPGAGSRIFPIDG